MLDYTSYIIILKAQCTSAICPNTHALGHINSFNSTTSHSDPDFDLRKMIHRQVQAFRLEFFSRKLFNMRKGLVAKQSGSAFISEHHLLPHLVSSSWRSAVSTGFACASEYQSLVASCMHTLQSLRPNHKHRRRTALATTLHFSHH